MKKQIPKTSLKEMKLGDLRRLKTRASDEVKEWYVFLDKIVEELKRRGKL